MMRILKGIGHMSDPFFDVRCYAKNLPMMSTISAPMRF